MAARSIASLSLSFGLVSIPVKVFSATESAGGIGFNLLHACGSRVRQQYVCIRENVPVERSELVKGYEFDKDRYVMFEPGELKALEEAARHTIDIVSFLPLDAVDPIFYDKAYYLAPDKRGAKPFHLLLAALKQSGRCALATWAWKGKQYVVQVRPADAGLVLQQLLYADEVRPQAEVPVEKADVQSGELALALQLVEQNAVERYDPKAFRDEEKERIQAAIDRKIEGRQVVVSQAPEEAGAGAEVIDLMQALRASLGRKAAPAARTAAPAAPAPAAARERKGPKRASPAPAEGAAPKRKARATR